MTWLAECPVCHQPLRWTYMLRPLWSQWPCAACGSLLSVNRKRRLLVILPFMIIVFAVMWMTQLAGWGLLVALPMILAVWLPYFLLLDRVVVAERYGFRCKTCGYDLRGQVAPRCPECGREFDAAERAFMQTGTIPAAPPRPRRNLWIATAVLICAGALSFLAIGIQHYYRVRARAAPLPRAAAPGMSPAAQSQAATAANQPTTAPTSTMRSVDKAP